MANSVVQYVLTQPYQAIAPAVFQNATSGWLKNVVDYVQNHQEFIERSMRTNVFGGGIFLSTIGNPRPGVTVTAMVGLAASNAVDVILNAAHVLDPDSTLGNKILKIALTFASTLFFTSVAVAPLSSRPARFVTSAVLAAAMTYVAHPELLLHPLLSPL